MPMYEWRDPRDGSIVEVFRLMKDYKEPPTVEEGADPYVEYERVPNLGAQCDNKEFAVPIKMCSLGLTSLEAVRDFQKRNPGVTIEDDMTKEDFGVPIAHSRAEKLGILRKEGWEERNGDRHRKVDLSGY